MVAEHDGGQGRPLVAPSELSHISGDAAEREVALLLGRADEQPSGLLRQRFSSEFQGDWRVEVGRWLATAQQHEFFEPLWKRLLGRVHGPGERVSEVDPNDTRHHTFLSELAPAMLVHYLVGTGWSFGAWEPERPREGGAHRDVDVTMVAPGGVAVDFQVKAPDRLGRRVGHRVVDGEVDAYVVKAVEKAADQLPRSGLRPNIVVVSAQRNWPLMLRPEAVVRLVLGGGTNPGDGGPCLLPRRQIGAFARWEHVGAVVLLDLIRRVERTDYGALVLVNAWAREPVDASWFSRARVCEVLDDVVHWHGGPPDGLGLPPGTRIVERLPWE